MGKDPVTDAIHHELCAAIAELAKSVDIAVKRMAIRAKFTAAMTDAQKTERAAAALRAVALQNTGIVLGAASAPQKPDSAKGTDVVEELNSACHWLMEATMPVSARRTKKPDGLNESAFALRLLELHDRTGGFLKSDSHV
jgi:hypothetical protein